MLSMPSSAAQQTALRTGLVGLCCGLIGLLFASTALGQGAPSPYVQRDMTLQKGTLRVDLAPGDFALLNGPATLPIGGALGTRRGFVLGRTEPGNGHVHLNAGASFGILDELEVGTLLLPIQFAPDGDFGDIEFYGRYRFVDTGALQVGGHVTMQLPTDSEFGLGLGVPLRWFISSKMMLDTGAEFELLFESDTYNLDIPAALLFQITPEFFVGPRTGFVFFDFEEIAIPVGVVGGYALSVSSKFAIDLIGSFVLPTFINSFPGLSGIELGNFEFLFGANFHFAVM